MAVSDYGFAGRVVLHPGYPEHPQNCEPALGPLRAVRRTISWPQAGQGTSDESVRSDGSV